MNRKQRPRFGVVSEISRGDPDVQQQHLGEKEDPIAALLVEMDVNIDDPTSEVNANDAERDEFNLPALLDREGEIHHRGADEPLAPSPPTSPKTVTRGDKARQTHHIHSHQSNGGGRESAGADAPSPSPSATFSEMITRVDENKNRNGRNPHQPVPRENDDDEYDDNAKPQYPSRSHQANESQPTHARTALAPSSFQFNAPPLLIPPEIKCPICLDPFQSPVTLQCNHNVCRSHILDLAACDDGSTIGNAEEAEGEASTNCPPYKGPNHPFAVKCPKCRRQTLFREGERSICVNHEMNAMAEIMLTMLAASSHHHQSQSRQSQIVEGQSAELNAAPNRQTTTSTTPPNQSRTNTPPQGSKPKEQKRRVRFDERETVAFPSEEVSQSSTTNTAELATKRTSPQKHSDNNNDNDKTTPTSAPTNEKMSPSSRHRQHILNAQQQLLALEKQLNEQREKLRHEREEMTQRKAAEYKRERQDEIARRKQLELLEIQNEMASHGREGEISVQTSPHLYDTKSLLHPTPATGPPPPTPEVVFDGTETRLGSLAVAEEHFRKVKRERERQKECEREMRERAIREEIEAWKAKANPAQLRVDDGVLEKHLNEIEQYTSLATDGLENIVSRSTKLRVVEDNLFAKPNSATARRNSTDVSTTELSTSHPPAKQNSYDDEVERKLWQVELKVNRERDEVLSREKMAQLAEDQARAMINSFQNKSKKVPPKPTYIPKINRMQKI